MTLGSTFKRAFRLPPHVLAQKIAARLQRCVAAWRARRRDQQAATYVPLSSVPDTDLPRYFQAPDPATLRHEADQIRTLAAHFLEHRFDLLGSGWVQVAHGMACRGVEGFRYPAGPAVQADPAGDWLAGRINPANLPEARRLWQAVEPGYRPIDWHLDFKSGWRWSEAVWYQNIRYAERPGADVKVLWELARMQHLPMLAWAHLLDGGQTDRYAREFRNQVLDFLATNPPRFGVNWQCTMDVAIRVCNWLVAYDLFRAGGAVFDGFFQRVFHRAVAEHADHIAHNLEWGPDLRGNHYLADIVGLIFAAAYLPHAPCIDAWLALGVRELVAEVPLQFGPDGANFEASCTYHRLSAEMVVYATALVLGLPPEKRQALQEYDHRLVAGPPVLPPTPVPLHRIPGRERVSPFPPPYLERLERLGHFTTAIARPDGQVPQFGDNDSGRFLKLRPESGTDHLCHAGLAEAIAGLFDSPAPTRPTPTGWERDIICALAKNPRLTRTADVQISSPSCFPDFGLFVYRTRRTYLAVRCGRVGQNDHGGHAHNDQLSIELAVDGVAFVVDPGTCLYTPVPGLRNRFRATAMHNTLALPGREQNPWLDGPTGLFRLADRTRALVKCCTPGQFVGEHHGYGVPCRRTLLVDPGVIAGIDECDLDGPKDVWFHLAPGIGVAADDSRGWCLTQAPTGTRVQLEATEGEWTVEESLYSAGYGLVEPCRALRLRSESRRLEWRFVLVGP